MRTILFAALLFGIPKLCLADPPMGQFFGLELETSSGTFIGYTDKLYVRILYDQVYGTNGSSKTYSDDEVVELLRKEPKIVFFTDIETIALTIPCPTESGDPAPRKPERYAVSVSSGLVGAEILSSSIKRIVRHPGTLDGKGIWAIIPVSAHDLELLKTRTPNFICRNGNSEMNDHLWISYNPAVGAGMLKPFCERSTENWPTESEQRAVLANKDVLHLVIAVD